MPRGSPPKRRELRSRHHPSPNKSPSPRKTRQTKPSTEVLDQDKILELWSQFTADHYEMVEQLPLELHRNSRLLKEMDQESVGTLLNRRRLVLFADSTQHSKISSRSGYETT